MISVGELDNIAHARIEDAKALLTAGRCSDLPDSQLDRVSRHWQRVPGLQELPDPELDVLLRLSGQEARIKQNHFPLWNAVAIWKVESRYNVVGTVQQPDATAMIQAAEELVAVL